MRQSRRLPTRERNPLGLVGGTGADGGGLLDDALVRDEEP
jgi:hypothetical protein